MFENVFWILFSVITIFLLWKGRIFPIPFGMVAVTLTGLNFKSKAYLDTLMAMIADKVAFLTSGILRLDSMLAKQTGRFVAIPQYDKLGGDEEQLVANTDLTVNDISQFEDQAVWLERGKAWGSEDWTRWIAGESPLDEIARQISDYYARRIQAALLSVLTGVFTTALYTTHSTKNAYNGAPISIDAILGAKKLLGDSSTELILAILNSKVWYDALKEEIANYQPLGSTGAYQTGVIQKLLGMTCSMDDGLTPVTDIYPTYFGAPGSAVYSIREQNTEPYRLPLKAGGTDVLVSRISVLIHVPGVKWNVGTTNPTNVQLATDTNWAKVYTENRNIKLVQLNTL